MSHNLAVQVEYADPAELDYSIRHPAGVGWTLCAICHADTRVDGPMGFAGYDPICQPCLFKGSEKLGMVIALVTIVRKFPDNSLTEGPKSALRNLKEFCDHFAKYMNR
jgi:hypothetical protein